MATCLSSAIGTLVMAFVANKPFAMAPGMGLNSFFAVVVANIAGITGLTYLQSFQADAVGTVAGSVTGTSTVTTFVESAAGVEAGDRTGLTALTTAVLFLACMFIAPIAAIIPAAATSSALIYVGLLMIGGLKEIDFSDMSQALPAALMLIAMPISGSIGHGIGLALISFAVIKVFTGKAKEVSILTMRSRRCSS